MQPIRKTFGALAEGWVPFVVTLVYVVSGAAWVIGNYVVADVGPIDEVLEAVLGLGFVLATALVLFAFLTRNLQNVRRSRTRLEESEASHRAAASLFQALIDAVPAVINVKDRTGRYVIANEYFARLFGRSKADVVGCLTADLYGAESTAVIERLDGQCFAEGRQIGPLDVDFTMPVGDVRSWLTTRAPLRDEDGTIARVATVALDVTEHKRSEEALRHSEERYRLLFHDNPAPMWVYDRETLAFLEVNAAAAAQYGYSRDEFLGMTIRDIRPSDDLPMLEARLRSLEPGLRRSGGWRHRCKDGSLVDVEILAHDIRYLDRPAVLVQVNDVTERLRAEAAARRSHELLQSVIDAIPASVYARDRMGHYTFLNRHEAESIGVPREAAIGRTLDEIAGPDAWQWREDHDFVLRTGRPAEPRLVVGPPGRPGTENRTWLLIKTPLRDAEGDVDQVVGIGLEITEQRRLEERLRHAQKLEAVGQLTGGIAHDFNNMLGVIIGSLELLRLDAKDSTEASIIDTALGGAGRAADLTRRLLIFSRHQTLQAQPIDVDDLLRRLRSMLRRTIGEDIEVVAEAGTCRWRPLADPAELDTAILNLAINARDAMPSGGRLTIGAKELTVAPAAAAPSDALAPGDYVVISVTDTGTGIPKDILDQIFEPFFTTKEASKGTGLGLSMVYGFVKQSGGDVRVTSEQGVGTTIALYLPRAKEPALDRPVSDLPTAPMARPGETVLLVEDDAGVRDLAERLLGGLGYTVRTAPDGPSAIPILESGGRLDLMLTDVVMPNGMTGLDVAARARVLRPNMKILFMSGYAEGALGHVKFAELGDRLMQKPFRRAGLARALRDVLDAEE